MSRRRPARLRAERPAPRSTQITRIPQATLRALDRSADRHVSSQSVARALATWRTVVRRPASVLAAPHNDWVELIGPMAREELERALRTLSRRHAAPLRAEIAVLDEAFRARTVPDPWADPARPSWRRRLSG